MQTMQSTEGGKRRGVRLSILLAAVSLAIGTVVWFLVSSRPDPAVALPAGMAKGGQPVNAIPAGNPTPRPATGVTRPAGPELPAMRTQTVRPPQQAKPLVLPNFKPEHIIRNPPWRNGPPVRTPNPGKPTVANSQAPASPTSPAPPSSRVVTAAPNGATRNAPGQHLPYLAPARRLPTPPPINAAPKAD